MSAPEPTMFKLSVRYAAGHTHEFAPSGEALTADQLVQASGAFLRDLTYLEGKGITKLVAEVMPVIRPVDDDRQGALRTIAAMAGTQADATYGRVQVPHAVVAALANVNSPAERDIVMDAIAVLVGGHWQDVG